MPAHKTIADIGEFGLIDQLSRVTYSGNAKLGIGDDTAVLPVKSQCNQLLATDMLAEGVHFYKNTDLRLVGRKAINANISDIAAMGGLPRFAVISLGVPASRTIRDIKALYAGMNSAAKKFNVGIVGGDTIKTKQLTINVAMTGEVSRKNVVLRRGAKNGHILMVTGPLGNSLKSNHHLTFTPRVAASQYLVRYAKPSAMIDISDGFLADLGHLLRQSEVGAEIYEDQIPLRKGASLKQALCDGEDFELLFTVTSAKARRLEAIRNKGLRFYRVGRIIEDGLRFMTQEISAFTVKHRGFDHYRK